MSYYDNMTVKPTESTTLCVVRTSRSHFANTFYSKLKISFTKYCENLRVLYILYLLISPVSGGPFILPEKTVPSTPITSPIRHSHRGHPRVGIGEDTPFDRETTTLTPEEVHSAHQLLPTKSSTEQRSQNQRSSGEAISAFPRHFHLFHLHNIFAGFRNALSSLSGATQAVPTSSKSLLKTSLSDRGWGSSHQTRTRAHRTRGSLSSVMDEHAKSAPSSVGRERRATASTPSGDDGGSGRRRWENPCPNLDPAVDENATPQSLATLILKAIHGAKSQVDQFINEFAREMFHVDSWEASLPEHQDFSLQFLNNSSGVDLSTPEAISFAVALQEAYELMQRRAVGIEQVTLDQALYQASFLSEFRGVEHRIVYVLCELRHAMIQSGVTPKQEITKDVMEEGSRDMDGERERNIRDAVILREYVSGLELLHALFYHYEKSEAQ